jgi:hypothetical protein
LIFGLFLAYYFSFLFLQITQREKQSRVNCFSNAFGRQRLILAVYNG